MGLCWHAWRPRPETGLVATLALILAGCSGSGAAGLPSSCLAGSAQIQTALNAAPAAVRLSDGTALSQCVRLAGDALENVGSNLDGAAAALSVRMARDPAAALRLGYLIGAAQRGVGGPGKAYGPGAPMVGRIEQFANVGAVAVPVRAALHRGLVAGRATG